MQERVVDEPDAGHQVARVERDLLGLGEVVRRVAVEGQGAHDAHGTQLLRDDLRRVEQVDAFEGLVLGVGHHLHPQLPLQAGCRARCGRGGRGGESRDRCRRASATPPTRGCGCRPRASSAISPTMSTRPAAVRSGTCGPPNPSIVANERGIARSDMTHRSMCVDSGFGGSRSPRMCRALTALGGSRGPDGA